MTMFLALSALLLFGAIFLMARKSGRDAEGLRHEKEKGDMARKTRTLRDRLVSDSGFAARVRKRFTR